MESDTRPTKRLCTVEDEFGDYDVFISHRGPDTETGFVSYLYEALQRVGLQPFLDCISIAKGQDAWKCIDHAIKTTSLALVIFSKNFAQSEWCLKELHAMLDSPSMMVLPVFYEVQPWEVSFPDKGQLACGFMKLAEKHDIFVMEEWRADLKRASKLNGWEYNVKDKRLKKDLVLEIVGKIFELANKPLPLDVGDHVVGVKQVAQNLIQTIDTSSTSKIDGELKSVMCKYEIALEDLNKANELEPYDVWILRNRGEVKRLMGKYEDAMEDFNKANELEPNDVWTLKKRGEVNRLMGMYRDALEDCNKAIDLEPNGAWILKRRGEIMRLMGKYEDAMDDFNKVNELEPNDVWTLKKRGEVKRLMGMYIDALEDFNKANELEPNGAWILKRRGEIMRMMGKYEDALDDFNKVNELEPNDVWILKRRGEVMRLMDRYGDALEVFNKVDELEPNDIWTLRNRGEVKRMMGKYADALEDFNKGHELQPNDAWTLGSRGEVKKMMGKYTNALEDFNKANELQPNDAWILGNRGEVKSMMGKYADALEDFNKANELQPNNIFTLGGRGEVKRLMGKYVDAMEDLNKANELEPYDVWILRNRGEVKRLMGKYEDAMEDFNKANELEPNDVWTLKKRGEVNRLMGMYIDALEDFNKVNELEPSDAWILKMCGEVKQLMGKHANASDDFNKVDELEPNDAWTKEMKNLSSLITLNLNECSSLATLPKEVGILSSLTTLDLSGCSSLVALPNEFGNLFSLTTLNLRQCSSLATLPKEVGNLSSLTTFNLTQCSNLVVLPKEVGNLYSLITLNLEDCSNLATLPKEVGNLSSLTTLNLWRCSSLSALPKEVGNLSSLTTFNLRLCSSLVALPKEVRNLSSLTTLNLEDCSSLKALPMEMENSSSLITLNLEEHSSKAQAQTTGDDEYVLKKHQEEVVVTQFEAKSNLSKIFNYAIQKPLLKILSFLTIKGFHVLGFLLLWIQICIGMSSQQVLSWNKGKVESKDLITKRFLGQGCSGIFYETTWSLKNTVRLARKDFPGVTGGTFVTEAIRLFELREHPNIVKTFCWTVDNRSCSLVMEYMKDDLSSFMRKKKEVLRKRGDQLVIRANPSSFQLLEALDILLQIAIGIEYLHDKGIYHGDLKPNNIFLDWKKDHMLVKVVDFGLLETKRNTTLLSQRALCFRMIEWSAPELFEDFFSSMNEDLDFLWTTSLTKLNPNTSSASCFENGHKVLLEKADSYSFGLTSAYILGGEQIWPVELSPQELWKQISSYGLRPELPSKCPETLASLICACWHINPTHRPTFSNIRNMLQDIIKEQGE